MCYIRQWQDICQILEAGGGGGSTGEYISCNSVRRELLYVCIPVAQLVIKFLALNKICISDRYCTKYDNLQFYLKHISVWLCSVMLCVLWSLYTRCVPTNFVWSTFLCDTMQCVDDCAVIFVRYMCTFNEWQCTNCIWSTFQCDTLQCDDVCVVVFLQ
jgi:hypothetical protein